VESRRQFRPKGAAALRQELRQRGVEGEAIEAALADSDPVAEAYKAVQPQAARLAALAQTDPMSFRRKLSGLLLRRGFAYGVVHEVVNRLARENGADSGLIDPGD